MLEIKIMQSPEELELLEKIHVRYQLWDTKGMPETYVQMGYIPGDGFYVKMTCMEADPLRRYTKHRDPVWQDSAMEIFLQLSDPSGVYMNFELNANGAILTEYGPNRRERCFFEDAYVESMHIHSEIRRDCWCVWYQIPEKMLARVYKTVQLHRGSTFRINLYKVCQGCTPGEYGSYQDIPLAAPSFHEPQFFADAMLV